MKRINQRSGTAPHARPLRTAELARARGGATMVEYALLLRRSAADDAALAPAAPHDRAA